MQRVYSLFMKKNILNERYDYINLLRKCTRCAYSMTGLLCALPRFFRCESNVSKQTHCSYSDEEILFFSFSDSTKKLKDVLEEFHGDGVLSKYNPEQVCLHQPSSAFIFYLLFWWLIFCLTLTQLVSVRTQTHGVTLSDTHLVSSDSVWYQEAECLVIPPRL